MDNIRKESFLGSDKVIVGNKYTDLVLETLGKVYIKTGNSSQVLSDVLALLDKTTESEIRSQTIIVGSLLEMEQMEYPGDGFFVYNTLTTTLYISYDERYIALIEAAEGAGDGYVRRKGDTMTGQLEINTVGPPLIVASSKLISNLNAEYIGGYSADDLAKKRVDEYITGNWTFKGKGVSENNWTFKENVRMYGDLVTSRSLTSPEFASGFGGYGWRLDADTNTLTVDYLIVRKAMRVYEMVINKISATNGSIWVSNSSKCSSAVQPTILTDTQLGSLGLWSGSDANKDAMLSLIKTDTYYLPIPNNGANTESTVTLTSELSKPSMVNTTPKTFVNYKFIIYVKDPIGLVNSPLFSGPKTLYDEALLASEWSTYSGPYDETTYRAFKKCISLYYISKEKVVTKWGGAEGTWEEGTTPEEWTYSDTFDKDFCFYIIPNNSTATNDFEMNGHNSSYIIGIKTYYKYFGLDRELVNTAISESNVQFGNSIIPTVKAPNLWIVNTDDDEYPLFKPGDIIRCQKYSDGNIKYYDAIVMSQIGSRQYIVQKATSVFDTYTKIEYNDDGSIKSYTEEYNDTQYSKTEDSFNPNTGTQVPNSTSKTTEARLDDITEGDDMVQMGNIQEVQRQNAIYLTSSDDDGPYIDVISGLNRPDYSVLYSIPTYSRREFIHLGNKHNYYYHEVTQGEQVAPCFSTTDESGATKYYNCTQYPTRRSIVKKKDGKYKYALTKTTRVRVGNLRGIYNEIFGKKQPYGFGLYGENVFLTGEFYLNNGTSVVDFSEESILIKFRNAGLEIRDIVKEDGTIDQVPALNLEGEPILDEDGNPTYRNKTEIYMNADQFVFSIAGNPAMSLKALFNDKTGQIENVYLDVQGWIQSNGLYIYPKGYTSDPKNPIMGAVSYITDEGKLTAYDAHFENCYVSGTVVTDKLTATGGSIGGFTINNRLIRSLSRNYFGSIDGLVAMGWSTVGPGRLPEPRYREYPYVEETWEEYEMRYNEWVGRPYRDIPEMWNNLWYTCFHAIGGLNTLPIAVFGANGSAVYASSHSEDSAVFPNKEHVYAGYFDGNIGCSGTVVASNYGVWSDGPSGGKYYGGITYTMTKIDRTGNSGTYNIHVKNGIITQVDH